MTRLCDLVEQVLAQNQEMNLRLRNIDNAVITQVGWTKLDGGRDASVTSSGKATPPRGPPQDVLGGVQRNSLGFAFEEDLLASRVYRKPLFSESGDSLVTSAARTTAWSILSALSLTDVSNISMLAVPIYAHEISNSARYSFGNFKSDSLAVEHQGSASIPEQQTMKARKRDRLAHVLFGEQVKAAKPPALREPESKVLGVPLQDLIRYNNVAISLRNEEGESYIYGYIPLFVAKPGWFLKENGQSVSNHKVHRSSLTSCTQRRMSKTYSSSVDPLFASRNLRLLSIPPRRYGKGLDWSGYTVHDAACPLLRFLLRLPESVIPVRHYEAFHVSIGTSGEEIESAIRKFQQLITLLPPPSRQLLLYLLDIMAVFCSKSEINKMTSQRLAAIFQPAILSPVKAGEDFIEEMSSRQLSQDVLTFLIERQDHFLVGMA